MRANKLINEFGPYTYEPTCDRVVGDVEIKNDEIFKDWVLIRISRLSVMPVPDIIWNRIVEISQTDARFIISSLRFPR